MSGAATSTRTLTPAVRSRVTDVPLLGPAPTVMPPLVSFGVGRKR